MTKPVVEISRLKKIYKGASKPAVDDLSFCVMEGDIFGLLGPNGAGKSTTLMILCGLLHLTEGSVRVLNCDVGRQNGEIRKQIGIATQDIALFPTMTARENLTYFGRMYGLKKKTIRERVDSTLHEFGLMEKADTWVLHFSGGMKRRLNLVAALLHQPRLLILDEPTSGVDVQSRTMILDHMKKLQREGCTIIYSSHLLDEAEKICSQFAIIDGGRLIASGTLQEMLAGQKEACNLENMFLQLTGRDIRN
ncbi:MAG: ABC transporter ATP-binding protein [Syntrophobacterales bacterium]|jgi:ABC-2 type transport system ATP-binding protein|nr:ABC transporter ATP-binding protein [Syntrophobacterales bacterium]